MVIELAKAQYYTIMLVALFYSLQTLTSHLLEGGWDNAAMGVLLAFFIFILPVMWGRILTETILSIIQIRDRMDLLKHATFDNQSVHPSDVMKSPFIAWLLRDKHAPGILRERTASQAALFTLEEEKESCEEQPLLSQPARAPASGPPPQIPQIPSHSSFTEIDLNAATPPQHARRERRSMSVSDVYKPQSTLRQETLFFVFGLPYYGAASVSLPSE